MVFSMNEDECNVLHEKQNVINENMKSCFRDTLGEGLGSG